MTENRIVLNEQDDDFIRECIRQRERAIDLIAEMDRGRWREFENLPDGNKIDITSKVREQKLALVIRFSELIRNWATVRAHRVRSAGTFSTSISSVGSID